jgi:hypothetical protein
LEKAVYGMMKSDLLFYQKWVADLTSLGFTINPYGPCVAKKIVDGHQLTIGWHVDDLLIGHPKPDTVTLFLAWIAKRYNMPDKKVTPTWGSYHDYLGINIDFSDPGMVKFDMVPYIRKIIDAFPEKITGVTSTPAALIILLRSAPHLKLVYFPKTKLGFFITLPLNSSFYPVFVMISRLLFLSS